MHIVWYKILTHPKQSGQATQQAKDKRVLSGHAVLEYNNRIDQITYSRIKEMAASITKNIKMQSLYIS